MKGLTKYFAIISAFVLPIMLANVQYIDDLGRSSEGYSNWGLDGRPLSDYLMYAIFVNFHLVDIFPLSTFIGCAFLCISFYLFNINMKTDNGFGFLIPFSFLFLPFTYEFFSYRFDVIPMCLSVSMALYLSSFSLKNKVADFFISFILSCCILSTYQPTINLAISLLIMTILKGFNNKDSGKQIFIALAIKSFSLLFSLVFYTKAILPLFNVDFNGQNHPGISADIFNDISRNAFAYFYFVKKNITVSHGGVVLLSIYTTFVLLNIYASLRYVMNIKGIWSYLVASLLAIISIMTPVLCMSGMLTLSNHVELFPRVYVGLAGMIIALFYLIFILTKNKFIFVFMFSAFSIYTLGFTYAYGNSLKDQNKVDTEITNQIKYLTRDFEYNTIKLVFYGDAPRAKSLTNASKNYPLIETLVPKYFGNWIGPFKFMSFNGYEQVYPGYYTHDVTDALANRCAYELYAKSQDFFLKKRNDVILVDFSKNDDCK